MRIINMLKWLVIIGATVGAVFGAKKLLATTSTHRDINYTIDRARPYGKVWGVVRPPGLPSTARHASLEEDAAGYIASIARDQDLGENFVRVMLALADKESSMTFARPANNFNLHDTDDKISAWGAFQWNQDAWDRLGVTNRAYIDATLQRSPVAPRGELRTHPWEQTALQEIAWPIRYYARIWRTVKRRGGDDIAAGRAVFIWHSGPTRLLRFYAASEQHGWYGGWQELGQDLSPATARWYAEKTDSIDERLVAAGVTP